jgi:hypothetical protein
VSDRVGRLHQQAATKSKKKKSVADNKRKKTNVATNVKKKQQSSNKKRKLNEIATAPSQNLKKGAGQSGLAHVAEPTLALPLRKPMAGANEGKGSISLTAGLPDVSAGPQPEPPTDGSDALNATIKDLFRRIGSPELPGEVARLGDIKEIMGGKDTIEGSIGGGESKRPGFDRQGMVPGSHTADPGPQNGDFWTPGSADPGTSGPDPHDPDGQGDNSWRPSRGHQGTYPGFGQTPGNADTGIRFGRGGETSGDGAKWHARETQENEDGSTTTYSSGRDENGGYVRQTTRAWDDGSSVTRTYYYKDLDGVLRDKPARITQTHGGPVTHTPESDDPDTEPDDPDTDSQPNPEGAGSGESLPCPATARDCGPGTETVSDEDLVSQPGKGDDTAGASGFTASIVERKDVVTNPVDPENHMRRGGGRQPRPIQHVTKPK